MFDCFFENDHDYALPDVIECIIYYIAGYFVRQVSHYNTSY